MNDKIILGIVGQISSGKTTVANYLAEKYDGTIFGFSQPLRRVLEVLNISRSRENLANLSSILRRQFGDDTILKALINEIREAPSKVVLVEGLRRQDDFEALKTLPGFHLIAIAAEEKLRFQRLTARRQNPDDANKTWEQFLIDEKQEAELQIPSVMKQAEFTLNNNLGHEKLIEQLQVMTDKIFK